MATTLQTGPNDDNPKAGSADGYQADGSYVVNISGTNGISQDSGQKSGTALIDDQFPGARKKNPLGDYSSYNYSITLYMVTPEFMNEFCVGRDGPSDGINPGTLPTDNDGIYVIAQSGGINNSFDKRLLTKNRKLQTGKAGGAEVQEGLDFYIEDLNIDVQLPQGADNLATTPGKLDFKIVEPIGFSFLQDLAIASTRINGLSSLVKASPTVAPNTMQQMYILGIRFYGYDVNGNLVNPSSKATSGYINTSNTDNNSITERFIPIQISQMTFKLDDKATIYSFSGSAASIQVAFGERLNALTFPISVGGSTVDDVLRGVNGTSGLMKILNLRSQNLVDQKRIEIPNQYEIEWIGGDQNPIATALLVDDTYVEKQIAPMYPAATTSESNAGGSVRARTYDPTSKTLAFQTGTSITEVIDNIIVKSSFITEGLNAVNNGATESKQTPSANLKELEWYYINPVVKILGRDSKTNDWAYKVTYQIGVYKIPYIRSEYKNNNSIYPGPYKVYNYIYTGENSEILEFEQNYNNLFNQYTQITAKLSTENVAIDTNIRKKVGSVPLTPASSSNSNSTGGKQNAGSALNENFRAQLYSADQSAATLKILGDPDWIMSIIGIDQKIAPFVQSTSGTSSQFASKGQSLARQLYGPGYSINPYGGQVFLQIIFGIATDYQDNGLLDVGNDIMFYQDTDVADNGIQGFVYQAQYCHASFSRGLFTQTLDLKYVPKNLLLTNKTPTSDTREDPIDRARREAEDVAANDEINSAIDNADWDATGKNTNPLESYANDDRSRQQNNATNATTQGREVTRPNTSNTRQSK